MKKEEKTELTRVKIFNAALEEFGANGYLNGSINTICKKHSISKGLIYYNYKNKDALYLTCIDYAVDKFIAYMDENYHENSLDCYMKLRYHFFDENKTLARLISEVVLQSPASSLPKMQEIKSRFDSYNRSLYQKAMSTLTLRKGITEKDAVQYYDMLQNMLNSCLSRNDVSGTDFITAFLQHEEQLERILNYMLYGIAVE